MNDQPRFAIYTRVSRFIRRFFLWFLLLALAIWSYGFYEIGRTAVYRENPELYGQQQATELLKRVGELIQLPANETPTMATINDAASAKKAQPFLANAENGDVLIIYANAQTAILYRPSENKLIAVGPVSSGPTNQQTTPQPVSAFSATSTASTTSNDGITSTKTKK